MNDDQCLDYIFRSRFPELVGKYYRVRGRKCYSSQAGNHLHPLAGTMFENSSTPLSSWFRAIDLLSERDVTAMELSRQLGVTYKCAWRIKKQITKKERS